MSEWVLLFPGQGSQTVGMARDLATAFSEVARTIEEASDVLGLDVAALCFADPAGQLALTEFTQPAILTVSTAIHRVLRATRGLAPALVAGHSLGEYSALIALGAITFADALRAVRFRGQAMQRAVPIGEGGMVAYVGAHADVVRDLCARTSTAAGVVEIANVNSPAQLVLSGHRHALERVADEIARERLGDAIRLAVSAPFHSSLMAPAACEMEAYLRNLPMAPFAGRIVANVDAAAHGAGTYGRDLLVRQITSPVRWTESLATIQAAAAGSTFVEVGPGTVLAKLLKRTLPGAQCLATGTRQALEKALAV